MLKVSISDHEKARILGLGNDLPLGSEVGLREAMIAGRIAGPAAALDVLKKPRAEAPGNARQFGLRLHHEYFGRYMIFGPCFAARYAGVPGRYVLSRRAV